MFFGSARVGCNSTRRRFPGEGGGYEEAGACDEGMKVGRARQVCNSLVSLYGDEKIGCSFLFSFVFSFVHLSFPLSGGYEGRRKGCPIKIGHFDLGQKLVM